MVESVRWVVYFIYSTQQTSLFGDLHLTKLAIKYYYFFTSQMKKTRQQTQCFFLFDKLLIVNQF